MDLISSIGVVLLILQASLSTALRMRLRYAILAVELLPPTIRSIGLGCIGIMFANSLVNVLYTAEGHFTTCLSFSLALVFLNNESLARELRRANSLESNLAVLKKQAIQQQEGFNKLMTDQADSEVQASKDTVQRLKEKVKELEIQNKHLADDAAALKKHR